MNPLPPSLPFTAGMVEVREVLLWSYHCLLFCSKSTYIELGHFIFITAEKDGPNCLTNFSHHPLGPCISYFSKMYFADRFPVSHADTECPVSFTGPFLSDHLVFSLSLLELQTSAFMLDLDVM